MSARPGGIPEYLPCGHLAALSYVSAADWTAWCMVCEQRMNLPRMARQAELLTPSAETREMF